MDFTAWLERRSGQTEPVPGDKRDPEERDRARVIHSSAFRRLQGKTQLLGITEGDFHRTRLTHTMEVAQIARGIVLQFQDHPAAPLKKCMPSTALIETISFCHDLGHPPFGHSGESALNYAMRDQGGFEGNGQSLRLITRLAKHTEPYGIDPTRRVVLGVLKYPAPYSKVCKQPNQSPVPYETLPSQQDWKPPKCYLDTEDEIVRWVLKPLDEDDRNRFQSLSKSSTPEAHGKTAFKSLDTSIMDLADNIAYATHDLEDGISLKLITREHWTEVTKNLQWGWLQMVDSNKDKLADLLFDGGKRKLGVSRIVHGLILAIEFQSDSSFKSELLTWNANLKDQASAFVRAMTDLVSNRIINTQAVQTLEYRGRHIILRLFDAIMADPLRLLGESFSQALQTKPQELHRVVCDYISGMTDSYASRLYERFYVPRQGSVFEKL